MKLKTAFYLGRISNLPTLWSNTLVGIGFAGLLPASGHVSDMPSMYFVSAVCFAFSLFYVAGMYLNDVCDADWDAQHQPSRPIPAGEVNAKTVVLFALGFIIVGFALLVCLSENKLPSALWASLLLGFILLYDWRHKSWPRLSPLLMGACRLCVYLGAASLLGISGWSLPLIAAALSLLLYIAGITVLARAEHENRVLSLLPLPLLFAPILCALALGYSVTHCLLVALFQSAWIMRAARSIRSGEPGSIGTAVSALLAGICLIDAAFLFALGYMHAGWWAVGAFLLCLGLQKIIPAT